MGRPPSDAILSRLARARELVHDDCCAPLRLDDLARAAGLSRWFFLRSFTAAYGRTPHQFITHVRLERAKRALARGATVTDACFDVGFASLGSFSTLFRRELGVSPVEWRRRARALVSVPERWPALFIPGCYLWHFAGNF